MALINPWDLVPKTKITGPTVIGAKALPKVVSPSPAKVSPVVKRPATGLLGRFIPSPTTEATTRAEQEKKFQASLEEPAAKVGEFFVRPIVAAAKAIESKPETFKAMLTEPNKLLALKTILTEEPKEVTPVQNKYLGEEPITGLKESKTVGGVSDLLSKFTAKVGVSPETTRRGVEAAALPLLALFAEPGIGGLEGKATKEILEEGVKKLGKETLEKIMKEEGAAGVERALKSVIEGAAEKRTVTKFGDLPIPNTVKVEDPLIQEARKYKSAEEFVKAQTIYRGQPENFKFRRAVTDVDASDNILIGKGVFNTSEPAMAGTYGKNILEFKKPTEKILDISNASLDDLKKLGVNENTIKVYQDTLKDISPATIFGQTVEFDGKTYKVFRKVNIKGETMYELQPTKYGERIINKSIDEIENIVKPKQNLSNVKDAEDILMNDIIERFTGGKSVEELLTGGSSEAGKLKTAKEQASKWLNKQGYNFVKHQGGIRAGGGKELHDVYIALSDEALKPQTKSQLTDIWNKAQEGIPKLEERGMIDKAGNIRMDKINAEEDVKEVIRTTAKAYEPQITAATRSVQTQAATRDLATNLGMTYDDVIKRKVGQAYNAEQMKAASDLMVRSADDVAAAEAKYTESGMDEDLVDYMFALNRHSLIQASVSGAKAESGRALAIQKLMSSAPKKQQLIDTLFESMGGKEVTKDIADRLAEAARRAKASGDYRGYYKLIREFNKPKFGEKVYEYWLNSVLSGVKTHVVNTTSNLYKAMTGVGERYVQALIELPLGSKKTVTFNEANQYAMGAVKGLTDGVARALRVMKYGIEPETLGRLDIKRLPAIGGTWGEVVRTPTKLLAAEDEFFKAISGTAEQYAQAYRTARAEGKRGQALIDRAEDLILNPTDEMMKAVKKTALEATFQQDLGKWGRSIMNARNVFPGLKYLIPFIKTPTNIFKEALASTPVTPVYRALMGSYKGASKEVVSKDLAKAAVGSSIMAGLMLAYQQGLITGPQPLTSEGAEAWARQGKLPTAMKIGDRWVSLARIEPLATIWNGIAGVADMIDKGEDPKDAAMSLVGIMVDQMKDKTFLQGLSEVFSAISARSPEERSYYLRKIIHNALSGMVPNIIGAPTQALDESVRDIKAGGLSEQVLNSVLIKIPWFNQLVPEKLSVFGAPIKKSGSALERIISPFATSKETTDPLEQEMERLDVVLSQVNRAKTVGGVAGKLSYDMLRSFIKDEGQIGKALLTKTIMTPYYKNLNDEDKATTIKEVMSGARKLVSEERAGELLLSIVGIDPKLDNQATVDQFNKAFKLIIKEDEWKNMEASEKVRYVIESYSNMILFNNGADPRKTEELNRDVTGALYALEKEQIKELPKFVPDKYAVPLIETGRAYDLSPSFLSRLIQLESTWDPKAKNPTTSATGLGQHTDDTYEYIKSKYKDYDRTDPLQAMDATAWYLNDIANRIGTRNEDDLLAAYKRGVGGYLRMNEEDKTDIKAYLLKYYNIK